MEDARSRTIRRLACLVSWPVLLLAVLLVGSGLLTRQPSPLLAHALSFVLLAAPISSLLVCRRPRWWAHSPWDLGLLAVLNGLLFLCSLVLLILNLVHGGGFTNPDRWLQVGVVFGMPMVAAAASCTSAFLSRRGYPPGHCRVCGYRIAGSDSVSCSECGADSSRSVGFRRDHLGRLVRFVRARARTAVDGATKSVWRRIALAPLLAAALVATSIGVLDVAGHLWVDDRGWDLVPLPTRDQDRVWWADIVGPISPSTMVPIASPSAPLVWGNSGRSGTPAGPSRDRSAPDLVRFKYVDIPFWARGTVLASTTTQMHRDAVQFPFGPIRTRWIVAPSGPPPPAPRPFVWNSTVHWRTLAVHLAFAVPVVWLGLVVWGRRLRRH
ncbi:MAG: hypothetical protein AB8G96_08185 [Phycisphaerales bacterium]